MRDADLDRILSKEEGILPSSGFAASVMEAVQREAAAPPPIPFPWKRAIPGLCAAGLMFALIVVGGIVLTDHGATPHRLPAEWSTALASIGETWKTLGGNWIALALVLSLASAKLSMHLVAGRSTRSART